MTPQQFLQDTIDHYHSGNRAVTVHGTCTYQSTETSEGCAIGKHLPNDEARARYDKASLPNILCIFNQCPDLKALAPRWMQEMDGSFLATVQAIHDGGECWDENGLSTAGRIRITNVAKQFGLTVNFK